jgi:DNA gyrase subunit B
MVFWGVKMAEGKQYSAENIKVLEGLEGVRLRPAMYIGSTGKSGLHHLVYEVVDNSVDEAMGGHCTQIDVTLNKDGSVTVIDNGRGIPVDMHPVYKVPALEVVITKLHAGGKFDKGSYKISGGLHGVGISVVAALSKLMKVQVKRGGKIYTQDYKIGKPLHLLKTGGDIEKSDTGTEITFYPDDTIFSTVKFDFGVLETRFREIAFLNKGLKIVLKDEASDKKEIFHYEGGLIEFAKWVNETKDPIHKAVYFIKEESSLVVECAVQYNAGYQENVLSFVNTINTVEGGTHVVGFRTALTRALNDYAGKNKLTKEENLTGDDVREGLTAIVSVKVPEPQFEGQTKTKLGNTEVKGIVEKISYASLSEFFEENPNIARRIVQKGLEAQRARNAAKKAKDLIRRKSAFSVGGLPGKLADCSRKSSEDTELYLVEGDSAGGCFSGDTQVALADGRNVSFVELVEESKQGKQNFCYTIKSDGSIGVEKILNPRITKKNAEVIKIELDNGHEITCTPDHKFMLRDGTYKEAQYLKTNDSLMPLHKRISKIGGRITIDGYEMVWDQDKNWIFTHLLADQYNIENSVYNKEQGDSRHHIDFNKRNNDPSNIIRLSKEEYLLLHTEHLTETLHRPDIKQKTALAHQNSEYRKKVSAWAQRPEVSSMLSTRAKKQWADENYKQFMTKKFADFYNSNESYRQENTKRLNTEQQKYWNNEEHREKAAQRVKQFFVNNPDARQVLSEFATEQWKDQTLLQWRRQKTSEQWTPEFRRKRKIAYDQTYYNKTIALMKKVLEQNQNLDSFETVRLDNKDRSVLSADTFCNRFFNGNKDLMLETVQHYNHKIKRIELLTQRIDVYDIEIPYTHNFALTSGIFVHNSAKQARNKEFQAILPLKGKILNVEKANIAKVFSSEEIANLITAMGTGIGDQFNVEKLRYSKVIIMTDADVDGAHIRTLLLTFFFRFMKQVIENGNLYIAVSPLYKVRKRSDHYVYSDAELKTILKELGQNTIVQRFKGLGEMNPEQLWDTTMNPKTRLLNRVIIEDAVKADQTFSILMGSEVEPRKNFIIEKAHQAEIDI